MIRTSLCALMVAVVGLPAFAAPAPVRKGIIVLDAAQFLAELPSGDSAGAGGGGGRGRGAAAPAPAAAETPGGLPAGFSFESFAINLRVPDPFSAQAVVPDAGAAGNAAPWYLYVRAKGGAGSSFKVALNGKTLPDTFADAPASFKVSAPITLSPGPLKVTITGIQGAAASFDVLLLSRSQDLKESDLPALQYPEDMVLLKEFTTVSADGVKFGDLNGDGKMDLVVLTPNYSCYAYDNSGKELWHWDSPAAGANLRSQFEAPGSVWDFDRDGKAEVIHWRNIDGKEYVVMSDGATGNIKYKTEWPNTAQPNHVYNNFRTAIAKTHAPPDSYPDTLLVLTDSGGTISLTAYGPTLNQLWSYSRPHLKDYNGHYIYPVDINGDGLDEVYISHVMLKANGGELWNNYAQFPDNHDHIDSARFVDVNGDGKPELVTGQSDVGTVIYNAQTGQLLWQRFANHNQKIEAGNYRTDVPGPQVVANARYYAPGLGAQLRWFDAAGKPLSVWPAIPLSSNPNFAKGDFKGDGKPQLFWYRFRIDPDGTGTMAFPDEVFHMFDFMGNGTEQPITLGRGGAGGVVRVYGFKDAPPREAKRDPLYLAHSVSNHTHY